MSYISTRNIPISHKYTEYQYLTIIELLNITIIVMHTYNIITKL